MHIKNSKTEAVGVCREPPNHVALILTHSGNTPEICGFASHSDNEFLPKNIIETAVLFGVRFLTFCCPDNNYSCKKPAITVDLKILFHLLLMDDNWLRHEDITVRFFGDRKERNLPKQGKLHVSVVSQIDGRVAIVEAVKKMVNKVEHGEITSNEITSRLIAEQIAPIGLPDPDLLIFTGGLKGLDNGLIWQSAYSEFAFVDEYWESLTADCFERILEDYMGRDRRFGGLAKEVHSQATVG
jgi:undecaprenyl diphosphate synthase